MATANTISLKPRAGGSSDWRKLVDLIYPVGTYYTSSKPTSPSTLFGGTWRKIENRFLYAVSGSTELVPGASTQGGSNNAIVPYHNHSMTQASYSFSGNAMGNHTHSFSGSSSHNHLHDHYHKGVYKTIDGGVYAGTIPYIYADSWKWDEADKLLTGSGKAQYIYNTPDIKGNFSKYRGQSERTASLQEMMNAGQGDSRYTTSTSVTISGTTGASSAGTPAGQVNLSSAASVSYAGTSGNATNANMPAYQKVYCWYREN